MKTFGEHLLLLCICSSVIVALSILNIIYSAYVFNKEYHRELNDRKIRETPLNIP